MLAYFHSKALNFYFYPGLATMRHNLIMSRQDNVATWFDVYWYRKPISIIESAISIYIYIYIYIYREFLLITFAISHVVYRNLPEWVIIEQLSIRRQVRILLISWGQKTCVKHYYVHLSLWYEFWFALICIDMNVILELSTAIQPDNLRRTKCWLIFSVKLNLHHVSTSRCFMFIFLPKPYGGTWKTYFSIFLVFLW